jgi:hypothetical protein
MGYYSLLSECGLCGTMFSSNPDLVPCYPCLDGKLSTKGVRSPVCEECFNEVNRFRVEHNLPPNRIMPGAYGALEGP